ncbi:interleukin-17C [Hemicordylus capensis]|uniref:interleukin-17C n=1 Tax=Hemicordylus capensis TaxID=884348 RepID=UPI002302DD4E|nr:interleukin-17C [Hemicordylus capensis]
METGAKLPSEHLSLLLVEILPPRVAVISPQLQGKRQTLDKPASIFYASTCSLPPSSVDSAEMWSSVFALLALFAWTDARHRRHHQQQNCFSPQDLQGGGVPTKFLSKTARWERHTPVQLVPYVKGEQAGRQRHRRHNEDRCPNLQNSDTLRGDINERAISPWTYRLDEDENRYPAQLAFAECLCKGCIDVKTGRETKSLNSVSVFQDMMVLQRTPCHHSAGDDGFTFEVKHIKVPVACACVLPPSSR